MKTTIYWTVQHSRRAMHEFRFRITYCWLGQQVEFLEWRLGAMLRPDNHEGGLYALPNLRSCDGEYQ